ncbi:MULTISPECIES: prolyl oligopeptidase family serine peptidase [Paracoccus]|uniref:prolyl oligopeptidase family serine peptidase n=1 Tax=Paracoccus TaxID=265 RepID=UPI001F0A44C7|nr:MULTISPECIES: prolyl oligopeptidase family serine peptidase [Paracoccus]
MTPHPTGGAPCPRGGRGMSAPFWSIRAFRGAAVAVILSTFAASAAEEMHLTYPETPRTHDVETLFGVWIADPFRWLEADPRTDTTVTEWIDAQNAVSSAYLETLPARPIFQQRLTLLNRHDTAFPPIRRGERYFFQRQGAGEDQPRLILREGTGGPERVLLDPSAQEEGGTRALAEWDVSPGGDFVAYALQKDGSDWRSIHVMDAVTGEVLDDRLEWARFTTIAWSGDGSGFYYSRFPAREDSASFNEAVGGHAVYFHRLGTAQSEDRLVHGGASDTLLLHTATVSGDGRFLVIYSSGLSGGVAVTVTDLSQDGAKPLTLVESQEDQWALLGTEGTRLIFSTQMGAPRGRVMAIDLADPEPAFAELIPERPDAVLRHGTAIMGDRIVLAYMVDARMVLERYRLDGTPDGSVDLPGAGTIALFQGEPGRDDGYFLFTSHEVPPTVLRLDVARNRVTPWHDPNLPVTLDDVVVEQRFYASADGTRIPIFVIRRADVTGSAPTMMTGYGGFGISMVPYYMPGAMAWVEQGGVYAVANIRGGGEYGAAWHHAGRRALKQNVFDDFIAAGEYLIAEGITAPDGLAIHGLSNGGLLVAAVANQRPDLFAAVLPDVGVMDMLRFDRFTGGAMWVQEYGSPAVEDQFRTLLAYSPLHGVRDGTDYPAILVTTADTDDRVVPAHSLKYAATLQAADIGARPHLLRVAQGAGHGQGTPLAMQIAQMAEQWAFAAHWTGLEVTPKD